jgi:hypothetical protein
VHFAFSFYDKPSHMLTPAQISIVQPDDALRKIIVEPILEKNGNELIDTRVYKIYKDAFGDETVLITEPRETGINDDLADQNNPDYLGKITLLDDTLWNYEGDVLSADEQLQVVTFLGSSPI